MKAEDERFKASGFHHIHSESMAAFSREFGRLTPTRGGLMLWPLPDADKRVPTRLAI